MTVQPDHKTSWSELLYKVDDFAEDIILSAESSSDKRNLSAATLPALLRRLTTIETTSQSQIWSFLLHLRLFVGPKYILKFLHKRFFLSLKEVEAYAVSVREEVILGSEYDEVRNSESNMEEEISADGTPNHSVITEPRHVIGTQYYWLSSSAEIAKHKGDELAADVVSCFPSRNDPTRIHLESYSSIKMAVLMFLETWLVQFTEDFMFSALEVSGLSSPRSSSRLHSSGSRSFGNGIRSFGSGRSLNETGARTGSKPTPVIGRMMNDLVEFLRSVARCPYMELLGVVFQVRDEEANPTVKSATSLSDLLILPNSQFEKHFPCISKLLHIISDDDAIVESQAAERQALELQQQQLQRSLSMESSGDDFENRIILDESPAPGEAGSRSSLRMSFYDKFGGARLSEILEFEEDGDLSTITESFRIESGATMTMRNGTITKSGSQSSMSRQSILDRILSTPLPSEARLSMIHNEEKDKFYLKIAVGDVTCTYTISTTLVSAMMAASMELRAKMIPLTVLSSQCYVNKRTSISKETIDFSPPFSNAIGPSPTASTSQSADKHVSHKSTSGEQFDSAAEDDLDESSDMFPNTPMSPSALSDAPPSISVAMISKLTQCLQVMSERCMNSVFTKNGNVAVVLSAVELQLAQQYVMSDSDQDIVPVRVFASAIDRQILAYKDNRKSGLDRVASVLRDGQAVIATTDSNHLEAVDIARVAASPIASAGRSGSSGEEPSPQNSGRDSTFRRSILSWMGGNKKKASKNKEQQEKADAMLTKSHRFKPLSSLFYECDEKSIAHNLTARLHYMFCCIPLHEFCIDFGYGVKSKLLAPMLARLRSESERLQELFINEILIPSDVLTRAEVIIQIIKVGELLARMRSHHALMMIVFALQSHAVHRLKNTWAVVNARMPGRWDILQDLVGFGGQKLTSNFCSRQSKEGISRDLREEMFMALPDMGLGSGVYPLMRRSEVFRDFDFLQLNTSALRLSEDGARLTFMIASNRCEFDDDDSAEAESATSSRKRRGVRLSSGRSRASTVATQPHKGNRSHSVFEPWTSQRAIMMAASKRLDRSNAAVTSPSNVPEIEERRIRQRSLSEGSAPAFRGGISDVSQFHFNPDEVVSTQQTIVKDNVMETPRKRSNTATSRCMSCDRITSETSKLREDLGAISRQSSVKTIESTDSNSEGEENLRRSNITKSFRLHTISRARLKTKRMIGIVRSDGLDEAGGLPQAPKKPYLPFLNGILSRIIRLNEVPDFIRCKSTGNSAGENTGFLRVSTPGNSSTDPELLMINFGKLHSISNLLMLIRSCQLAPYDLPISFEIQCFLGRAAVFRGDDAMWERSKILE